MRNIFNNFDIEEQIEKLKRQKIYTWVITIFLSVAGIIISLIMMKKGDTYWGFRLMCTSFVAWVALYYSIKNINKQIEELEEEWGE